MELNLMSANNRIMEWFKWTEVNDLNTARNNFAGTDEVLNTAALAFGGDSSCTHISGAKQNYGMEQVGQK